MQHNYYVAFFRYLTTKLRPKSNKIKTDSFGVHDINENVTGTGKHSSSSNKSSKTLTFDQCLH